ncbi:MAG: hypothetical protein HZA90_20535 [Verrucomicrobia bacterium]|nr:hypothetical protein [Verrucomicrobiota bacterium]
MRTIFSEEIEDSGASDTNLSHKKHPKLTQSVRTAQQEARAHDAKHGQHGTQDGEELVHAKLTAAVFYQSSPQGRI